MAETKLSTKPDPYEPRLTLWQRYPHLGWALAVFVLTAALTYIAFPPVAAGDAAFVLVLPAVLWAYRTPPFKIYALSVLGAQVTGWIVLIGWLHHVTWGGLFLLGSFLGLLTGLWYLAAWWAVPRLRGHRAGIRIFGLLGLAGLWVVLEYVRGGLFGGFPWLPLAASQWQRPFMLQVSAYAGAWAVSFVLVTFGLGAAAYAHRIFFERATGLRKRSPEFTVALLVLMGATFPFLSDTFGQQRHKLLRIAVVQPYIPQNEKWDAGHARDILQTIERLTLDAARVDTPDVILWPEASVPWALRRDPNMADWLEDLAHRANRPLLLGAVSVDNPGEVEERWRNGAFLVEPAGGVQYPGYAKRKLVPFGEYIPLRSTFGWLEKFVPIGGDFIPGESVLPFDLPAGADHTVAAGVLICYEDIFPSLARESTLAGAELLGVLTNDAWYGEGGAAYQHAAHSVLRAVENRRPVVRCGNGGWSGWIDEYGNIRDTLRDEGGSVYFRGHRGMNINRDLRWQGRLSTYTQKGDWFVLLCAVLSAGGCSVLLRMRPVPPRPPDEANF